AVYTLSLHDALPICHASRKSGGLKKACRTASHPSDCWISQAMPPNSAKVLTIAIRVERMTSDWRQALFFCSSRAISSSESGGECGTVVLIRGWFLRGREGGNSTRPRMHRQSERNRES